MLGSLLSFVGGLGSLICLILVLIKMFKTEQSPVQGIIGIVTCGIWAFIWGWINASKHGIKNIMLLWTGAWILSAVGSAMTIKTAGEALKNLPQTPPIEMHPTE